MNVVLSNNTRDAKLQWYRLLKSLAVVGKGEIWVNGEVFAMINATMLVMIVVDNVL